MAKFVCQPVGNGPQRKSREPQKFHLFPLNFVPVGTPRKPAILAGGPIQ